MEDVDHERFDAWREAPRAGIPWWLWLEAEASTRMASEADEEGVGTVSLYQEDNTSEEER